MYFTSVLSEYEVSLRQQRRAKILFVVTIMSVVMWLVMYAVSFAVTSLQYEAIQAIVRTSACCVMLVFRGLNFLISSD